VAEGLHQETLVLPTQEAVAAVTVTPETAVLAARA